MILSRIWFESSITIPGKKQTVDIECASPEWKGWEFSISDGRLWMRSPKGSLESPTDTIRTELDANEIELRDLVFMLSEPLNRVRLLFVTMPGDVVETALGPSEALIAKRKAEAAAAAQANADILAAQAEAVAQAQAKTSRADSLMRARAAKAAKHEPKRPPWAGADPTPPPSPPEEDAE